jgi:hypothetical protein
MSPWKRPGQGQAPRDTTSPAAKRLNRERAEAAGLDMIEREARARREKSERLRKLREERDAEAAK